jgi:hypothetical protein
MLNSFTIIVRWRWTDQWRLLREFFAFSPFSRGKRSNMVQVSHQPPSFDGWFCISGVTCFMTSVHVSFHKCSKGLDPYRTSHNLQTLSWHRQTRYLRFQLWIFASRKNRYFAEFGQSDEFYFSISWFNAHSVCNFNSTLQSGITVTSHKSHLQRNNINILREDNIIRTGAPATSH